jgi:hypothetical protein
MHRVLSRTFPEPRRGWIIPACSAKHSLSCDPIPVAEQVRVYGGHSAFSVSQNGVLAYRRGLPPALSAPGMIARASGSAPLVTFYSNPALSPDGKRLAIGRVDPATNTREIFALPLSEERKSTLC